MTTRQWHILGGGSLGGLLACYLQLAGHSPQLILRNDASLQEARALGVTVREGDSTRAVTDLRLATPATLAEPIAQLFICTKAQQTLAAVAALAGQLVDAPLLVLMQNGMGVREELLARWPQATVLQAITTEGVYQERRFALVHAGRGETLVGSQTEVPEQADSVRDDAEWQAAQTVATLLGDAGLTARAVTDCRKRLWLKLAVNCVLNPLTALYRCRNGALAERPETPPLIDAICAETALVAQAAGLSFTTAQLRAALDTVAAATAANRSSMLQDVEAGRETEIDYINGFIVREAARYGIAVPHHERLVQAIKAASSA